MAFEKFNRVKNLREYQTEICGSIWKDGQFYFGIHATKAFSLKEIKFMVCYFDREKNLIGFKPLKKGDDGCFRLHTTPKKEFFRLLFKPFLEFYKIDYSKTTNYKLNWDKELGMIILDLNEGKQKEKIKWKI